jgi:hypothetical protein
MVGRSGGASGLKYKLDEALLIASQKKQQCERQLYFKDPLILNFYTTTCY